MVLSLDVFIIVLSERIGFNEPLTYIARDIIVIIYRPTLPEFYGEDFPDWRIGYA